MGKRDNEASSPFGGKKIEYTVVRGRNQGTLSKDPLEGIMVEEARDHVECDIDLEKEDNPNNRLIAIDNEPNSVPDALIGDQKLERRRKRKSIYDVLMVKNPRRRNPKKNLSKKKGAISLTRQLRYYREYQTKVINMVGKDKANSIFSGAIHLLSAGSSDFVQNYYINPILNRVYSVDQFSDTLMRSYSTFVQNLYGMGARRIGVTNLPPLGCLPAAITLFGAGSNQCVARLNQNAISFNNKLNSTSQGLKTRFPDLKLVVFDIYQPLLDMVTKPSDSGFFESRKACCGTGTVETAVLCNARSVGTCTNATAYVFWDGFHPSEAANQILAGDLLAQGFDLIS